MFDTFRPREYVSSIFDVDYEELWENGIRGLLFDIDNTLAPYDDPLPNQSTEELMDELREAGFSIWIISNGKKERVLSFAQKLKVPAVWKAHKPFPTNIVKIQNRTKLESSQLAIIGDQIFTDVWAGNRGKIYSILVKPISEERDEAITKVKRGLERIMIAKMQLNLKTRIRRYREKKAIMRVDGSTQLLAVIGDPIAHTFSPMIHQIFIDLRGDNFAYVPFHVLPDGLERAVQGAHQLGIRGINVTIPHKQAVMSYVCDLDYSAQLVGAVNTLQWTEKGYKGFNTDVDGFTQLLTMHHFPIKGNRVLILGAGGAACSALTVCYLQGAQEVMIYNRTQERAQQLVQTFTENLRRLNRPLAMKIRVLNQADLEKEVFPIVLQTTSAGMYPQVEGLPVEQEAFYAPIQYAADMVFNPLETAFCRKVKEHGGLAVGGLSMLFYQGLRSYEIWTGQEFTPKQREHMHARFQMMAKRRIGGE